MISGIKDIVGRLTGSKDTQELMQKTAAVKAASDEKELRTLRSIEDILTTINENMFVLTKHFTGAATSLETIQSVLSAQAAEEEFKKKQAEGVDVPAAPKKSSMEDVFDRINKYLSLISAVLLPLLGGFVLGFKKFIDEKFGEFWGNVFVAFSALMAFSSRFRTLVFGSIAGLFKAIGSTFTRLVPSVAEYLSEGFKKLRSKFSWVDDIITKVGSFFNRFKSMFRWVDDLMKVAGSVSKVAGFIPKLLKGIPVIGQVIAVVMSIFDGIKGAIEGYETGGVLGAIRGAISGVVTGLVGWIGDLAGWLVGSLMELLGFEELGASIKAFDFSGWLNGAVKSLFDHLVNLITTPIEFVKGLIEHVTNVFSAFREFFTDIGSGKGIMESFIGLGEKIYKSMIDFATKLAFHMLKGLPIVGDDVVEQVNMARSQVGLPALTAGSATADMTTEERGRGQAAVREKHQATVQAALQTNPEINEKFQAARTANDREKMHEVLEEIGITDKVERDHYIDSLNAATRVAPPAASPPSPPAPATPSAPPAGAPANVAPATGRSTALSQQASASQTQLASAQTAAARTPAVVTVSAPSSTTTNVQNNNQNLYSSSAALTTNFPVALA